MKKKVDVSALTQKYKPVYDGFGSIWCPVLKMNIVFTHSGWRHFRFESGGKKRSPEDIALRYSLIPCIPVVIKHCKRAFKDDFDSKRKNINAQFSFYELPFKIKSGKYVSVILRQVNGGRWHYFSVRFTNGSIKKALKGLY